MAVLLVRHAEAGERDRWTGPDHERPLSAEGVRQAEQLVEVLGGFDVARVLSSPYLRCTQTVAPLAHARGLPQEPSDDLAEGGGAATLRLIHELVDDPHGDVVLCTHGDVVEEVLDGLGIHRTEETGKGATWVLGRGSSRYVAPPPG